MHDLLRDDRTVHFFYTPFTHYELADVIRMLVLLNAVVVGLLMLYIGHLRWKEDRRSATVFLGALTLAMVTFGSAGVYALGRPPVWPIIILELLVEILSFTGAVEVVRESRRGVWARN